MLLSGTAGTGKTKLVVVTHTHTHELNVCVLHYHKWFR